MQIRILANVLSLMEACKSKGYFSECSPSCLQFWLKAILNLGLMFPSSNSFFLLVLICLVFEHM